MATSKTQTANQKNLELQATVSFLNGRRSLIEGENERLRALVQMKTNEIKKLTDDVNSYKKVQEGHHQLVEAVRARGRDESFHLEGKLHAANDELRTTLKKIGTRNGVIYIESIILFTFFACWFANHVRLV